MVFTNKTRPATGCYKISLLQQGHQCDGLLMQNITKKHCLGEGLQSFLQHVRQQSPFNTVQPECGMYFIVGASYLAISCLKCIRAIQLLYSTHNNRFI